MKHALIALLALVAAAPAADDLHAEFERGKVLYKEGNFSEALKTYTALETEVPSGILAKFNSLTCLAAEGHFERAEKKLADEFSAFGENPEIRAGAAYNLGTALLRVADEADRVGALASKEQELRNSAQWLQQSLLDHPGDIEAKNNLEYANKLLEKLKQQQQQKQDKDDQQDQQQQDQQNQDQQQEQDQEQNQDDEQKKSEQEQQKDQQQQQNQQQDRQQRPPEPPREIPKEVADNLLKAAREAELKALKMLREQQAKDARKKSYYKTDW